MAFQNITLLFGLAAIGIPIALHLIARKEPRKVVFPSIRLLSQRIQSNRSKLRIRRWWLLAFRIAAILALVFALSRPVIGTAVSLTWASIAIVALGAVVLLVMATRAVTKSQNRRLGAALSAAALVLLVGALSWGGITLASGQTPKIDAAGPVALAIVMDNTALSAWQDGQQTQLERMQQAAKQLLVAAGSDSRYAIVDRSTAPAQFALDLGGALSKVESLQPLEVHQSLESRIEAAIRLLKTSEIPTRQLVLISPLAESSFSAKESRRPLAGLFEDQQVRFTLWDVGPIEGVNRSISLPALSEQSPSPDHPVTVAAVLSMQQFAGTGSDVTVSADVEAPTDVESADPQPSIKPQSVTVECVLFPAEASLPVVRDGQVVRPTAKPVDRVSVSLQPGRDVEVQLTLPPLSPGLHHGALRLIGEDALPIDDQAFFTVEAVPPSRLLLVGDHAEEMEVIAWAISAPAPLDDPSAQYRIERVSYGDLAASRLADFAGVILLNPPESAFEEPELIRYREGGGAVLAAVGGGLGSESVTIDGWPVFERPWRVPPPGTFLQLSAPSHPAMVQLADTSEGVPFSEFRIDQYWKTKPREGSQVLMRYAGTEHPALIEQATSSEQRGGRLLVFTTPIPELASPTTAWNQLFSGEEPWPAFWLIRDVTRYLTGRASDAWTFSVGAPVTLPVALPTQDAEQPKRLQWFPPESNSPVPIETQPGRSSREETSVGVESTESSDRIVIGMPKHSGVHWVRGDRLGLGFTANLPRTSLSPRPITPAELDELFGSEHVTKITALEEMDWTSADQSQFVSLWSPIMLLAFAAFMLEQILGNRFYRQSNRTAAGNRSRREVAA